MKLALVLGMSRTAFAFRARIAQTLRVHRLALLSAALLLGCSRTESWKAFDAADGAYSVDMPGTPKLADTTTAALPPTNVHTALLERGARGSFQVSNYTLAMALDGDTAQNATAIDCLSPLRGGKFVATHQGPESLGRARGFGVTAEAPRSDTLPEGGYEIDRCYVVGTQMLHLIAVGPNTASMRKDAQRFVTSFAVTSR